MKNSSKLLVANTRAVAWAVAPATRLKATSVAACLIRYHASPLGLDYPERQMLRRLATTLMDAFRRAFQGALFAIWVPPAATYVIVCVTYVYQQLDRGRALGMGLLLDSIVGPIVFAGLGFLAGAMALAAWIFPLLFCLRLIRARHPLVASVAAASWTFWKTGLAPMTGPPFTGESTVFVMVMTLTAYVAAMYANIEPLSNDAAPA